ncbi:MFS transporter [Streptomyces sp. SID5475]|nr:MFS transporter [Streptomyces sp. SID5475]
MSPADTGASAVIRAGAADPTSPSAPGPSTPRATAGAGADSGAGATGLHPGGPGYRRLSLALFAAGVATFALLYSTQALLPAISADLRVTPDAASWTVSGATLGLALAVLPLSALSERFGRRALMTGSLTAAALIALAVPFAPDLGTLVALRTVQGVALAGVPASAMAFLAEEVWAKALVGAVGLFVAGNSIGGMSGRIVTGWVAQLWGWRAALGAIALLAVVCTAVFRLLVPRAAHFTPAEAGPRALLRTVGGHLSDPLLRRLYAIGALFMTVFGAVYTVIGYRLADEPFGLPQGIAGSVFLIYLVGTAASATAGRLVARLGRRGALYAAVVTTAAGLLVSLADAIAWRTTRRVAGHGGLSGWRRWSRRRASRCTPPAGPWRSAAAGRRTRRCTRGPDAGRRGALPGRRRGRAPRVPRSGDGSQSTISPPGRHPCRW